MGISGLLPLLKEAQVPGNIADFKGKTLAVDAYVWLHRGAFGCAEDLVKGRKTTRFVDYAMHHVRMLQFHNITPYVVFDGGPLPAKRGTEESREKSRADNLSRALAFEAQNRWKEARDCYTKCVDITPEMAYQFIKALRAEGIDYVVAPYEADAQLCYLEREGIVDGIITEDSDLLVFGCKHVIFKLEKDGSCVSFDRNRLASVRDLPMHGWNDTHFRRMAMLSGCDYLPSIPGIGLKKAHRLMSRYKKNVDKLLQGLRLEGSHTIPPNYLQHFNQAELAFIYQRVFCPREQRLVTLYGLPPEGLADDDEKWIGLDVAVEVARGLALGDLHPETRDPIKDPWPDHQPQPKAGRSKPVPKAGTLDVFFTRVKRTTSASVVIPVGKQGSGVTTLSGLNAARHRSQPTPPPSTPKRSKFFSKAKEKEVVCDTPETQVSLHWKDEEEIATQPENGRSPTPEVAFSSPARESIRSLSPAAPSSRPSPSQTPRHRRDLRTHTNPEPFTSPFSHISSPPAATPPDSMDRAMDAFIPDIETALGRSEPPSPTPTRIALASQTATVGSAASQLFSSQATVATSISAAATKGSSLDSEPSSLDDDVITTPTQSLRRTSAKRSRDKEDVEPATAEAESRARLVGQGWSSRWSLGSQASSSPAAAAPGGSDRKRQALPLSAAAPRILTAKNLNARGGMSYAAAVQSPLTARKTTLVVTPSRPPPKVTPSSAPAPAPASASPSIPVSRPLGMSSNALERFRYSRK